MAISCFLPSLCGFAFFLSLARERHLNCPELYQHKYFSPFKPSNSSCKVCKTWFALQPISLLEISNDFVENRVKSFHGCRLEREIAWTLLETKGRQKDLWEIVLTFLKAHLAKATAQKCSSNRLHSVTGIWYQSMHFHQPGRRVVCI